MKHQIKPRIFKGTRDFLPEEMIHREEILKVMRSVFQRYGFAPIETPAIEYLNVLSGKYGDEADRLIYRLNYKTGTKDEAALHYDLTVPFSRVIAMNRNKLIFPFKRYQIQPIWRADTPQPRQGRFREFYQCDIDVVGSKSILADAEIITMVNEILTKLDFKNYLIKVNNRKILNGIIEFLGLDASWTAEIYRSIDKLDKVSFDEVGDELKLKGLKNEAITKLRDVILNSSEDNWTMLEDILKSSETGKEGVKEIKILFDFLQSMGVPSKNYRFEVSLARGLDYYTGPIFETILPQHPHIGSLTGGGRYDNLIGLFSGIEMPAVGTSLGLDRIFATMKQLEMIKEATTRTKVLIIRFSENTILDSLSLASKLRENGINTELYLEPDNLKKQFSFANKKGIKYVVILGEDELKNNQITIKHLETGTQKTVSQENVLEMIE